MCSLYEIFVMYCYKGYDMYYYIAIKGMLCFLNGYKRYYMYYYIAIKCMLSIAIKGILCITTLL
jgi:hypothetical protein